MLRRGRGFLLANRGVGGPLGHHSKERKEKILNRGGKTLRPRIATSSEGVEERGGFSNSGLLSSGRKSSLVGEIRKAGGKEREEQKKDSSALYEAKKRLFTEVTGTESWFGENHIVRGAYIPSGKKF